MFALTQLRTRLVGLFGRRRIEEELVEELEYHIERETDRLVASGMDAELARAAARRSFGNLEVTRASARETWSWEWIDRLSADLRLALRSLRRAPGFSAVATLSLALGIGAATTLFSVVDAMDFRPLPYPNADRLVVFDSPTRGPGLHEVATLDTLDRWTGCARSCDGLALVGSGGGVILVGNDATEHLDVGSASPGFFGLLGIRMFAGRDFSVEDAHVEDPHAIVVTYEFWRSHLGGNLEAVGKTLVVARFPADTERQLVRVVGVLPPGFHYGSHEDGWMAMNAVVTRGDYASSGVVVARLRNSTTIQAANAEFVAASARAATGRPTNTKGGVAAVRPLRSYFAYPYLQSALLVLVAAVLLILLVSILNVAGLFIARMNWRRHELAVRTALGASRASLARIPMIECVSISLLGGILGIGFATASLGAVGMRFSQDRTGLVARLDLRVFFFACAVTLLVGILAGLMPAWRASRADLSATTRVRSSKGPTTQRVQGGLVIMQMALGLAIVAGAGLLSKEFLRQRYVETTFDPTDLHLVNVVPRNALRFDSSRSRMLAMEAQQRFAAIPGVISASAEGTFGLLPVLVDGQTAPLPKKDWPMLLSIGPDFLRQLRLPVISGREFNETDRAGHEPVAVVNELAAKQFWPGQSPLGRRIVIGDSTSSRAVVTVVGVAGGTGANDWLILTRAATPTIYRPYDQAPTEYVRLFVRMPGDSISVERTLLAALRDVTHQPVMRGYSIGSSEESELGSILRAQRFDAVAMDTFAAFVLLLVAIGVYGIVSFAVAQREHEIGVRTALGASTRHLVLQLGRHGAVLGMFGTCLGIAVAMAGSRTLRALLPVGASLDPRILAGASLVLFAIALTATLVPAWRARRVDPMIALRAE
jgi:putative ABC transport system permease protein